MNRRVLARIHRLTIGMLRREIEPVSTADYVRFLFRWQHVAPGTQLHGVDGTLAVIRQLEGFEIPAAAWETTILPARVARYRPEYLDKLCLAGDVMWGRLSPHAALALGIGDVGGAVASGRRSSRRSRCSNAPMPPRCSRAKRTTTPRSRTPRATYSPKSRSAAHRSSRTSCAARAVSRPKSKRRSGNSWPRVS